DMALIMMTASGAVVQMVIAMVYWIFVMRVLSDVGSEAVAGAPITLRIVMFTMMPAHGMADAAATLVVQNLGADQPDRAESSVWKVGTYNMIFLLIVSVIFFIFSRSLVGIFSGDP